MQARSKNKNSPNSTRNFKRLVKRVQDGDEVALQKLLAAVAGPMRSMAARFIGRALQPHLDPEDLVQAVSFILWKGLRSGKLDVAGPGQLLRLGKTLLRCQTAKAVRRLRATLALTSAIESNRKAFLADRPRKAVDAVSKKTERDDEVRHIMDRVNDEDRWMLELMLLGHSMAETSQILGVGQAALRMRLSRLRARLRKSQRDDETDQLIAGPQA